MISTELNPTKVELLRSRKLRQCARAEDKQPLNSRTYFGLIVVPGLSLFACILNDKSTSNPGTVFWVHIPSRSLPLSPERPVTTNQKIPSHLIVLKEKFQIEQEKVENEGL